MFRHTGHVKSMRAFDRLPPAVRQVLRDAVHNNITTKSLARLAKALKAGAVTETETIEWIRKQDAERVRRDEQRKAMGTE
jgi:hypothetical protein